MDRRDKMAMYGSDLKSLPDVDIDLDSMTATFYMEPDQPPPPPAPEPSKLEQLGGKIDDRICAFVDRLTTRLYENGKLDWASRSYSVSEWIPTSPRNNMDRSDYRPHNDYAKTLLDSFRMAWKERSLYRLARLHLTIIQKYGACRNNVQVELVFGEGTRWVPGKRFWVAFAGREAGAGGNTRGWFTKHHVQVGTGSASPCPQY